MLDVRDTGQIVAAGVRLLTNGHLNSVLCKCEIGILVCKYHNRWVVWLPLFLSKFLIMEALVGTFNKGPSLGIVILREG